MSQNARPQVTSRQHVSNSKNQAGHAGVHHSRWTLVVVSDSEEHGHHLDSDPICGLRTRTHVRRTREQVAPIADLFSECGKSPDDKKLAERHRHIASNCVYTTWRNGGRPEPGGQRINHDRTKYQPCGRCPERDQDSPPPRVGPTQSHCSPAAVPHPQRNQTDHEQDRHFVGNDVINVMADHNSAADYELGQRKPTLRASQSPSLEWNGLRRACR